MSNISKQKINRICLSQSPQQLVTDYCKTGAHFRREAVRTQMRGWDDQAEMYRELARTDYEAASKLKLCLRRQELEKDCTVAADSAKSLLPANSRLQVWIIVERNAFRAWFYDGFTDKSETEDCPTLARATAVLIERAQRRAAA